MQNKHYFSHTGKKQIKSMLNGYTMKRTKPEIAEAIQYYANECELYRLIDYPRACRNATFVKLLFWTAGCSNEIADQNARDLCGKVIDNAK